MKQRSPTLTTLPLKIVGSSVFGRYPKISAERTFNAIITDGWLAPYAGYRRRLELNSFNNGRGLFTSIPSDLMIAVIGNEVFSIDPNLNSTKVGELETLEGDVSIDENEKHEIAICDQRKIYIYNYVTGTFSTCTTDFIPGYVAYQDGYFISPALGQAQWRLNDLVTTTSWPNDAQHVGLFQTKPDTCFACIRLPGKENQLLVFGKTVTQLWTNVGGQLFPYRRSTAYNLDYGCVNPSTIARGNELVVWLAMNENTTPTIMVSNGGPPTPISTDGIDFKLASLTNPQDSYGFLFMQDGHLIYQLCFPEDNYSLIYDFKTQKFFDVTDENMNYHIAKDVTLLNNKYYFVSQRDGYLYEFSSTIYTYSNILGEDTEIPHVRVCPPIRFPNQSQFVANNFTFPMEQGDSGVPQRVDMSLSKDGGESFGNYVPKELNPLGKRKNKVNFWGGGMANDLTVQLRFWGKTRFLATDGEVSIFQ